MKRVLLAALAASFAMSAAGAYAQPGDFHRHDEWRKGYHMKHEDWDRGEKVDWHARHLRKPPHGYEWRQVDGNYVLAAAATGIIASVIARSH